MILDIFNNTILPNAAHDVREMIERLNLSAFRNENIDFPNIIE